MHVVHGRCETAYVTKFPDDVAYTIYNMRRTLYVYVCSERFGTLTQANYIRNETGVCDKGKPTFLMEFFLPQILWLT